MAGLNCKSGLLSAKVQVYGRNINHMSAGISENLFHLPGPDGTPHPLSKHDLANLSGIRQRPCRETRCDPCETCLHLPSHESSSSMPVNAPAGWLHLQLAPKVQGILDVGDGIPPDRLTKPTVGLCPLWSWRGPGSESNRDVPVPAETGASNRHANREPGQAPD